MSKGKRYEGKKKLNIKKVLGALIALIVIIMIISSIVKVVKNNNEASKQAKVSYYTAYSNNKFGVINNEGSIVIEPTYDEMIVIPNKEKPIFICTYDVNDSDGSYKTKVINEKNELIYIDYEKVEAIDNFDSKQNIWYENNVLRVFKDGKYGLINFEGEMLLPCEYDEINSLKTVRGELLVKKDNKLGLVNEKGQIIIPIEYKDILTMKEAYNSEYIIVNNENKYGVISTSGKIVIEPKYELVKYLNSSKLYAVKENGILKLINSEGQIVLESGYEDIIEAKGEDIVIFKTGKYGIMTVAGVEKIPATYDDLKYLFSIYYIAKKDGKYGIINSSNETIVNFDYLNMTYIEDGNFIEADIADSQTVVFDSNLSQKLTGIISEINTDKGYIKIYTGNEYKYYNFKFEEKRNIDVLTSNTLFLSKKDGKYGYVDKNGTLVIDYIYDDGTEQNKQGYAAIKKDGLWGSINKVGNIILDASINLDDSIFLDFIGTWHLDNNGLYYTK